MKFLTLTAGTIAPPAREAAVVPPRFPVARIALLAVLIGGIHFIPQALHFLKFRAPGVLLREQVDETFFAVIASRRAGEHPGQPDPHRITGGPDTSYFAAQPFPLAALAVIAWTFRVPTTIVFWAGSFIFPAVSVLLVAWIAWRCKLHKPWQLALLLCLFFLALPPPYWLIQARYVANILVGRTPDLVIALPYSRRLQPQFIALIHYLCIAASLWLLQEESKRARFIAAGLAGSAFGASFYSYFYSWSILLGWFILGGVCVWIWRRERLGWWLLAFSLGAAISVPYWAWVARHFHALGDSAAWGHTNRVAPNLLRELSLLVLLTLLLGWSLRRERSRPELLWAPLVLCVTAGFGAAQNVVSGIFIQPYHYIFYFARPAMNFALVALLSVWLERSSLSAGRAAIIRRSCYVLMSAVVLASVIMQIDRYDRAAPLAASVLAAQPALGFLRDHCPAGAVAWCPLPAVEEAIPLYTNAIPYYSPYMWHKDPSAGRDLLLGRIAAGELLRGAAQEDFITRLRLRGADFFPLDTQRSLDPRAEGEIQETEQTLLHRFRALLNHETLKELDGLCYALLPSNAPLESTRLAQYFVCRKIWSDASYSIFELERN